MNRVLAVLIFGSPLWGLFLLGAVFGCFWYVLAGVGIAIVWILVILAFCQAWSWALDQF